MWTDDLFGDGDVCFVGCGDGDGGSGAEFDSDG
jgi:hypothetical protein